MKRILKFTAIICLVTILTALASCGSTPLAAYDKAMAKVMEETSYLEQVTMSATATLDGASVNVVIRSDMTCSGNVGADFVASGEGKATLGSGEEQIVTPYYVYVKDGYYYYDYPNYNEDGSSYKYKLAADYKAEDPICDLLPLLPIDLDSAEIKEEKGKTVIVMTVKADKMAGIMSFVTASMDPMLFGMDSVSLTPYAMTVTTTLDSEGRVAQSTATMTASGVYYGAYMTVVYVYDVIYTDYGTSKTPSVPEDVASYPNL